MWEWAARMLMSIFLQIDRVVYRLVEMVYKLFMQIANATILSSEVIERFGRRVYVLLGIIMLFKVSFSFLNYILNPDSFTDKERGVGKLIQNVILVLVLIITTPFVFREAMELQSIILKNNVIGNVILGENSVSPDYIDDAGQLVAATTFQTFFHIDLKTYPNCSVLVTKGDDELHKKCENDLNGGGDLAIADNNKVNYLEIRNAYDSKKLSDLLDKAPSFVQMKNKKGNYIFDYMIIIPTLVGGFAAYILLLFCIDIATRSVQLAFLQLIAPVPIISRLDPKSAKSGMFSKWVKKCASVYADLFIRLLAIFFGVYIINEVIANWTIQDAVTDVEASLWVKVFIILGTLMFIKQVPQLLKDLTGIDLNGKMSLSPTKKLGEVPLVGKPLASGVALGGRTALNIGRAGGALIGNAGKAIGDNIASSKLGRGVARIGQNIGNSKFATGARSIASKIDSAAGNNLSRIGADFEGTVGAGIMQRHDDRELANMERVTTAVSNMEKRALEKIKSGEAGAISLEYNKRQAMLDALRAQDTTSMTKDQLEAHTTEIGKQKQEFDSWYNNEAMWAYIDLNDKNATSVTYGDVTYRRDDVFKPGKADATLTGFTNDYEQAVDVGGYERNTTAQSRHSQFGAFKGKTNDIKRKRMAQQQAKGNTKKS